MTAPPSDRPRGRRAGPGGAAVRRPGGRPRRTGRWLAVRPRGAGSSAGPLFTGQDTLAARLPRTSRAFHRWLNDLSDDIERAAAQANWFFDGVIGEIRDALNAVVEFLPGADQRAGLRRGRCRQIGWLGVVALLRLDRATRWPACAARRCWPLAGFAGVRPAGLLAGEHGHADRHRRGGADLRADRHPARHLDGPPPVGRPGRHPGARLDADDADLRLPGAADAVLRHRRRPSAVDRAP